MVSTPQMAQYRALPPGPSGSARPSFPVASAGSPHYLAGTVTGVDCPRTTLRELGGERQRSRSVATPREGPARRTAVIAAARDSASVRCGAQNGPGRLACALAVSGLRRWGGRPLRALYPRNPPRRLSR